MSMEIVRCARATLTCYKIGTRRQPPQKGAPHCGKIRLARERGRLETPKLIIEWDGETPTSAMCSTCRAIFPTLEGKEPEANRRLVESAFWEHVKAEHSDQPPPWENAQGNLQ